MVIVQFPQDLKAVKEVGYKNGHYDGYFLVGDGINIQPLVEVILVSRGVTFLLLLWGMGLVILMVILSNGALLAVQMSHCWHHLSMSVLHCS